MGFNSIYKSVCKKLITHVVCECLQFNVEWNAIFLFNKAGYMEFMGGDSVMKESKIKKRLQVMYDLVKHGNIFPRSSINK